MNLTKHILGAFLVGTTFLTIQCGGNVDLDGDSGFGGAISASLISQTVEDNEIVQTFESGEDGQSNEEVVIDAPEMGYVSETLVYIDCSNKLASGNPEVDYVALSCSHGGETIEYHYYCTASFDGDDNEIFVVTRDTDDDPVVTDELFDNVLVTCEEGEDGLPQLFEEEYIVS